MNFASRLKEERKRLGITQAKFAQLAGVHRNTQINYEAGLRAPEVDYISAIEKFGVDTAYLLSGSHETIKQLSFFGGLHYKGIDEIVLQVLGDLDVDGFSEALDKIPDIASESGHSLLIDTLVSHCPSLSSRLNNLEGLDSDLLAQTIESLENALKECNQILSPEKKAKVVVMLYRIFRTTGKVDQKMINDSIAIAE